MLVCPECAESIDEVPGRRRDRACPYCGVELPADFAIAWVDVARVSNLAEAGFLTDELIGMGIDARLYQADEFSGMSGRWATAYLIRVPSKLGHDAAARIRRHLAEDEADDEAAPRPFGFQIETGSLDPAYWRPVAMIVLAGVASFAIGRHSAMPEAQRREPRDSLSVAVDAIGQPLVTQPPPGHPRHRLTFDRRSKLWKLETDQEGDGRFDALRHFQASGAVR